MCQSNKTSLENVKKMTWNYHNEYWWAQHLSMVLDFRRKNPQFFFAKKREIFID
jgi:hypothetical protein